MRAILTFSGKKIKLLVAHFDMLFQELKLLQTNESEPMLNILTSWKAGRWTVHVFPRQLHRPWQYFEEGEKKILLSPASVDMGGVLITPREEDFNKISMKDTRDIFGQVCLDEKKFNHVVSNIMK